jgi:signal peptide peptidase SppA
MKYPKLLSEDLLLITPGGYASLVKSFELRCGRAPGASELVQVGAELATREGKDYWTGDYIEVPEMEVENGVAIIPVTGFIGRGLDSYDKGMGATDVDDVREDLDNAEADDDVRAILLDIDSPGGMVSGTPELADRLRAVEKPIYTFTAGLMCSAGYWLGCSTDGIFATRSADIGSIGVYCAIHDLSELARQMGIKVQVFSSGTYKGAGVPGTSLTDPQRVMIQDRIMEIADMFYSHVQGARSDVAPEDMQGQTFKGQSAQARGLVDQVVACRDDVLSLL